MERNWIFPFASGNAEMRDSLGGKGANLAEMTRLGFPVPPGFTITTQACRFFSEHGALPPALEAELDAAVEALEKETGKTFGDAEAPLLVSVRSGARFSMPGMMDTVLNLGMNAEVAQTLASKTGNPRFAADAYRRFVHMFGDVVLGVPHEDFEELMAAKKLQQGAEQDTDLSPEALHELANEYIALVQRATGKPFPTHPREQLLAAVLAVFGSWDSPRAKKYRQIEDIPHTLGTAVNVQAMVFGNMGEESGTGVLFTRCPATGERKLFGDFLVNAQGEDVVAGIRTPREISEFAESFPQVWPQLQAMVAKLESHFADMQDVEFTVEHNQLYLLQTRAGKRTAAAAVRIAVEMVAEGAISQEDALGRVEPESLETLLHPRLAPGAERDPLGTGIAASPGAASGAAVFSAERAAEMAAEGADVILVRQETSPEDIGGMHASRGILTACGGKASHAAVVARGMGKPCVAGASGFIVNAKAKKVTAPDGREITEGQHITIDGATGEVFFGRVETLPAELPPQALTLLEWADEARKLEIRANADTPQDANIAREFGAEGIGLCRTEHMFFEDDRLPLVREMIFAPGQAERAKALEKLLPFQVADFEAIFTAMDGLPVTIRLIDPPLHEFLPQKNAEIELLATEFGISFEEAKDRVKSLHEVNPMLGHRGCRLLLTFPEILDMQARAILAAASKVQQKGITAVPEIMVPLVSRSEELYFCRQRIEKLATQMLGEPAAVPIKIGTMIELPRACAAAHRIAEQADFFSFGTNDLTQMTFGFSRDDSARFLPEYLERGVLDYDPFARVDERGVGELLKMGIERGRSTKPHLKMSVCGEHGGDPHSIDFFHRAGVSAVSCSAFRVPVARLAAARAALAARAGEAGEDATA